MPDAAAEFGGDITDTIINDFTHVLREARQRLRISRAQLATSLEVTELTVVVWETGRGVPTAVNFFLWAHRLGYLVDIQENSLDRSPTDAKPLLGSRAAEYRLLWIPRALRKLRIESDLTQELLAASLGVSVWTLGMWETTQRTPRMRHLVQWCMKLDCRLILAEI